MKNKKLYNKDYTIISNDEYNNNHSFVIRQSSKITLTKIQNKINGYYLYAWLYPKDYIKSERYTLRHVIEGLNKFFK